MKSKRPGGRTPKLTPEVQKIIIDAVSTGTPRKYAAERAGVEESTVRKWCNRGKKAQKNDDVYFLFFTALKKAEADGVTARVARITKAAQGGQLVEETTKSVTIETRDGKKTTTTNTTKKFAPSQWVADAWMLERRCPDEFALQRKRDILDAVKAELEKAIKNGQIKPPDRNSGSPGSGKGSTRLPPNAPDPRSV